MMLLPNIEIRKDLSKFIRSIDDGEEILYFKDNEYFFDDASYSKFIKEVETMVRTSKDYAHFVGYIKNTLGMNFCEVLSKVQESDNVEVEMHHGPIFTLYDICEVILNWFLKNGQRINTFRVANKVLDEHYALHVQVIMLSKTMHEAVHNKDIFMHYNQAIGDLNAFIKEYTPYLTDEQKYKIFQYAELCKNPAFSKSFDTNRLVASLSLLTTKGYLR